MGSVQYLGCPFREKPRITQSKGILPVPPLLQIEKRSKISQPCTATILRGGIHVNTISLGLVPTWGKNSALEQASYVHASSSPQFFCLIAAELSLCGENSQKNGVSKIKSAGIQKKGTAMEGIFYILGAIIPG